MAAGIDSILHAAGPVKLRGGYQACADCGHTLQDFTGGEHDKATLDALAEDPGDMPSWRTADLVATDGFAHWRVDPEDTASYERCAPITKEA